MLSYSPSTCVAVMGTCSLQPRLPQHNPSQPSGSHFLVQPVGSDLASFHFTPPSPQCPLVDIEVQISPTCSRTHQILYPSKILEILLLVHGKSSPFLILILSQSFSVRSRPVFRGDIPDYCNHHRLLPSPQMLKLFSISASRFFLYSFDLSLQLFYSPIHLVVWLPNGTLSPPRAGGVYLVHHCFPWLYRAQLVQKFVDYRKNERMAGLINK